MTRGGGWRDRAIYCRAALRNDVLPGIQGFGLGFRSVLPPTDSEPVNLTGLLPSRPLLSPLPPVQPGLGGEQEEAEEAEVRGGMSEGWLTTNLSP